MMLPVRNTHKKSLNDNGMPLGKGGPLLLSKSSDITFAAVLCLRLFGCTDAFGTDQNSSH